MLSAALLFPIFPLSPLTLPLYLYLIWFSEAMKANRKEEKRTDYG